MKTNANRHTDPSPTARPRAGFVAILLVSWLLGNGLPAGAQVVLHPIDIYGTIAWNNPTGPVLTHLSVAGFATGYIAANEISGGGNSASKYFAPVSRSTTPYNLTVEGGTSGGIDYRVSPTMVTGANDIYYFAPANALGVVYPGPDLPLDFIECAGLIHVHFRSSSGTPVAVTSSTTIEAQISGFGMQAIGRPAWASTETDHTLIVRGGADFNLTVTAYVQSGSDPFLNQFSFHSVSNFTVQVPCDGETNLTMIVPDLSGPPAGGYGQIIGNVDMLTENEHWVDDTFTVMAAVDGPQGNWRLSDVGVQPSGSCGSPMSPFPGLPSCNSAGQFTLVNLLPSDFEPANPRPYSVYGTLVYGLSQRYQRFQTPALNGDSPNFRVTVPAGATVNLGNTFVMNPGWIVGDIYLCCPDDPGTTNSPLRHISRLSDIDTGPPDGIPDIPTWDYTSRIVATGRNVLGAGASKTATGGSGMTLFPGSFMATGPDAGHFVGDYRLTLGGLNSETTRWDQRLFNLYFAHYASGNYLVSQIFIRNQHYQDVEVVPTQTITNHHRYGMSRVVVTFHSADPGTTLHSPRITGDGNFTGTDFEGHAANYTTDILYADGTPTSQAAAAVDAQVILCLPQGNYTFTPQLESFSGGSSTHNVLPNFAQYVGPCSSITSTPCLQIALTNAPDCPTNRAVTIAGSITSCTNVASITYQLNNDAPVTVCNNCGANPSFSFGLTLADCANQLTVIATDVNGDVASVSLTLHYDVTPPGLSGCTNLVVASDPGTNGAVVSYSVTALDNCDGPVPVVCSPPPGSFFPVGTTLVTCTAWDHCQNTNTCTFTVTVTGGGTNCCDDCFPPYPLTISVPVVPGVNYLANPLCHGTNNTLGALLPNVPDGTTLKKWDRPTGTYSPEYSFDSGFGGWVDSGFADASGVRLEPGEGFLLINPNGPFTNTWTGCLPDCPPPCLPTNGCVLVGRLGPGTAVWSDLSSCPPICGTEVRIWNGTGFNNFTFDPLQGWQPYAPVVAEGHSAFVCLDTNTVCCTNNLVVNGSFELTSPPLLPNSLDNGLDPLTGVPGWTTGAGDFLEVWANTVLGIPAAQGVNQLEINAQSTDQTVSQTITNLSTNCPAEFCFQYTGRFGDVSNSPNNDFTVTLNGAFAMSVTLDPAQYATNGWLRFCTNFTPTSSTLTISFQGHPHDPIDGGAHIDDVALTQCCPTNPCVQPPVLLCPTNKTVPCGTNWSFDAPVFDGGCCGTNVTVSILSTTTNGACPVYTRVWLATDCFSNSLTCTQSVAVVDTTPPTFEPAPHTVTPYSIRANWEALTCGTPAINFTRRDNGDLITDPPSDTGFASLMLSGVEFVNVGSYWNMFVYVLANDPLRVNLPAGTYALGAHLYPFHGGAGDYTIRLSTGEVFTQTASLIPWTPDFFGVISSDPIAWVEFSYDGDVLVLDDFAFCTGPTGVGGGFNAPTAVDDCCTNVQVSLLSAVTNGLCPQVVTLTWQATDCCSNSATTVRNVTLGDTTPPVLTCASNKTVYGASAWEFDPPSFFDAGCGTNVALEILSTVTNAGPPQTITRTWRATDCCSNSVTCSQTVTVQTPIPYLELGWLNGGLILTWTNPAAVLQSSLTVTGAWTDLPGASSPYPVPMVNPAGFFRLRVAGFQPALPSARYVAPSYSVSIGVAGASCGCTSPGSAQGDGAMLGAQDTGLGSAFLHTGEGVQHAVDLAIPGRGFDWAFVRHYRSGMNYDGPLGYGWEFNYNRRLAVEANGDVKRMDGEGRADRYVRAGTNYLAPSGLFTKLVRNPDGSHTEQDAHGTRWYYAPTNSAGIAQLTKITDRNGNQMTFAYNGNGQLTNVMDTVNRPITYNYNAAGRLTNITDFTGRTLTFGYDTNGNLISATSPAVAGTPTGNDFPNGKTTAYTYSSGYSNAALNHNLLTVTAPNEVASGGPAYLVAQYVTDPANTNNVDRLQSLTLGGTNASGIGAGGTIFYSYQNPAVAASNDFATVVFQNTVTNRAGNVTDYRFNQLGNPVSKITFTRGLRVGEPAGYTNTAVFNPDGLQILLTNGIDGQIAFSYDSANSNRLSQGNLLQSIRLPGPRGGDQSALTNRMTYDPNFNFVTTNVDARGNATVYRRDGRGNVTNIIHRIASIREDFEYNAFGQLTAHVLPDNGSGHRRRDERVYYTYGPLNGYLSQQIVDSQTLALTTTYGYDAMGNLIRTEDPRGFDSSNIVNQLNQVVRQVSAETAPGSGIRYQTDTIYDANNNVIRTEVQNRDVFGVIVAGNPSFTTLVAFDILNHAVTTLEEISATGYLTNQFRYGPNGSLTNRLFGEAANGNQPRNAIQFLYDERDLVFRQIRGPGGAAVSTTQTDYDGNGNVIRTIEGLESEPRTTTYAYDGYDRLVVQADPLDNTATNHYDPNGNLLSRRVDGQTNDVAGSAGNVRLSEVTFTYDAMNRPIQTSTAFFDIWTDTQIADGQVTTTTAYNDLGQIVQTTDDNGHTQTFRYDTANRAAGYLDHGSNTVSLAYDGNGNATTMTKEEKSDLGNPGRTNLTTYAYDGLNRLIQTVANGDITNRSAYDSRGNLILATDGRGNVVSNTFDRVSRHNRTTRFLTSTGDGSGTVTNTIVTRKIYDDSNRLTQQIDDHGNTTTYTYDAQNRITRTAFADGTFVDSTFDVHDNRITLTDPKANVVTSRYDLLNRLTTNSIVRGGNVLGPTNEVYQYDGLSRLVSARNDHSAVMRSYDSLSQVLRETQQLLPSGPVRMVAGTYDGMGNQLSSIYPGGRTVNWTYNALDLPLTVSDTNGTLATYSYLGRRVERRDYANGTRADFAYDLLERLTNLLHSVVAGGMPLDAHTYAWDDAHNVTANADTLSLVPGSRAYAYDSADRLLRSALAGGPTNLYTLDTVGNRVSVALGTNVGNYTLSSASPPEDYQMNQYTTTPLDSRTNNANGNLTAALSGAGLRQFVYDYRNQLVAWTNSADGTWLTNKYDCFGRRLEKAGPGGIARYYYDGWQEIEEQDGANATVATHVWGNGIDELLSTDRGALRCFFHADAQDSVRAATDASGSLLEHYRYDDYGAPSFHDELGSPIAGSLIGNATLYTGRRYDAENGLYYYRTRYLDPAVGRFLTRDTIGIWGDAANLGNGYAYVGNNPAGRTDPSGQYLTVGPLLAGGWRVVCWIGGSGGCCWPYQESTGSSGNYSCWGDMAISVGTTCGFVDPADGQHDDWFAVRPAGSQSRTLINTSKSNIKTNRRLGASEDGIMEGRDGALLALSQSTGGHTRSTINKSRSNIKTNGLVEGRDGWVTAPSANGYGIDDKGIKVSDFSGAGLGFAGSSGPSGHTRSTINKSRSNIKGNGYIDPMDGQHDDWFSVAPGSSSWQDADQFTRMAIKEAGIPIKSKKIKNITIRGPGVSGFAIKEPGIK